MTKLTQDTIDEIAYWWDYDYPSAGMAALKMIDKYSSLVLNNVEIYIEPDNIIIDNLLDFLIWKNKVEKLKDITIVNTTNSIVEKIEIVNSLFKKNKLHNLSINKFETELTFYNGDDKFRIEVGKIIDTENCDFNDFSFSELSLEFITYYVYKFKFVQKENNKISFKCDRLGLK